MKKLFILTVLLAVLIIVSCSRDNSNDYGLSAYNAGNYSKAKNLASKGCRAKNGEACYLLANMYFSGTGTQADPVRASRLYIKSCDEGNGRACYILGKLYGQGKYVSKDDFQSEAYYRKANKILEKECSNNISESCLFLGLLYLYSNGVPRDVVKAVEIFNKSCSLNGLGCFTLYYIYNSGDFGIEKDSKLAEYYKNKACEFGNKSACEKK